MNDPADFTRGIEIAHKSGPLRVELTASQAVSIVAMIQVACRHPGTRANYSREVAEAFARLLQAELGRRCADVDRLLEGRDDE